MTVREQRAVRDSLAEFLNEHSRVEINGDTVSPRLERLNFFGPEYRDFARDAPETDVSVFNARAGIILSFPIAAPPRQLRFEWTHFDERNPVLRPIVYPFDSESFRPVLHRRETAFQWESDREREEIRLTSLPPPEPPPTLDLPMVSAAAVAGALVLIGFGVRSGASRRGVVFGLLAGALLAGAIASRSHAVATLPHPFQSKPEIADDEARNLFQSLHRNIYRAFEFRDEERIYDALAKSVAGQLLEDLYLQIRRNLTLQEQGGAVSRVQNIEWVDGRRNESTNTFSAYPGFVYQCRWTVTGTVEHWGHIHTRTNEYEAIFTIEGRPSGWKITRFEPLLEERIDAQIRLRQ